MQEYEQGTDNVKSNRLKKYHGIYKKKIKEKMMMQKCILPNFPDIFMSN